MRSSVVILLSALLFIFSFTPSVSAYANITLFVHSDCTTPFGEPAQLDYNSSSVCHELPASSTSFHFSCTVTPGANSTTHFLFSLYSGANCSDAVVESIDSEGPTGQCAPASVVLQGEPIEFGAQLFCSTPAAEMDTAAAGEQSGEHEVEKRVNRLRSEISERAADNDVPQPLQLAGEAD